MTLGGVEGSLDELIVSKYVAESITMIAGRFGHEGLCQLRTKQFCTQFCRPTRDSMETLVLCEIWPGEGIKPNG